MPNLEDRVTALEARVNEIAAQADHAADIAVVAAREALTAREAHQRNIELLNALRRTQSDHGARLDSIDNRLAGVENRFGVVDGKLGTLTAGMHRIESLLTRLVNDEPNEQG